MSETASQACTGGPWMAGSLFSAIEALRAEVIEQCAEVADAEAKYYADQDTGEAWDAGASADAESIAAAIRKLNDNA